MNIITSVHSQNCLQHSNPHLESCSISFSINLKDSLPVRSLSRQQGHVHHVCVEKFRMAPFYLREFGSSTGTFLLMSSPVGSASGRVGKLAKSFSAPHAMVLGSKRVAKPLRGGRDQPTGGETLLNNIHQDVDRADPWAGVNKWDRTHQSHEIKREAKTSSVVIMIFILVIFPFRQPVDEY